MPPRRTVLIVNPHAQGGALGRRWPELAAALRRTLGSFEERVTSEPGDATRLSRQAIDGGADTVVAIGGDGTIGEVAAGFFVGDAARAGAAALGILPVGTGGDFRRTLGLPIDLDQAAAIVEARKVRTIDAGHVRFALPGGGTGERVFINIASFGLSGKVDELVNRSKKRLGGRVAFLLATVRAGVRFQNQRVRLSFDGDAASAVDVTINTVAIANGRYFGGGMRVAPEAELDDGAFDVVSIGDLGKVESLFSGPRIYQGSHLSMDKVTSRRAREVHAESLAAEPVVLDIDGETPGVLPATFRLLPRALPVIAP